MAAAKAEADAEATTTDDNNNNIIVDEDELVQETIAAGRGDRDEQGVRDQWLSDEHIGKESTFDSRMPISEDVARLLRAYRLTCEGCDHTQAVRKVNAFVRETKRLAKDEEKKDGGVWAATNKFVVALVVAALSAAYVYRKGELGFLDVLLYYYHNNNNSRGGDDLGGFSEAQKANILRLRRQHAADAASKRQQRQTTQPPTWLENEQKEVWTPKQEKQFQKASREFSGVPKKERYKVRYNSNRYRMCCVYTSEIENNPSHIRESPFVSEADCRKGGGKVADRVPDPSPDARTPGETKRTATIIAISICRGVPGHYAILFKIMHRLQTL